ncbi:hypothetical protein, conserved [Leishmania tarentolae]|uniref:Major facilitator superfamily (MFS) profile domain-containing protein n=1 Tax=Leishmania tarentolae TaxID=5689 RepID=A0A640KHP3_LEITA|nr:hypothetical protein, conserved [Leishmania tarentolae]
MPSDKPAARSERLFEDLGIASSVVGVGPKTTTSSNANGDCRGVGTSTKNNGSARRSGQDGARGFSFIGNRDTETVHARNFNTPDNALTMPANRLLDASVSTDQETVYCNLLLFIWLKTIGSFDSGAFSAALGAPNGISETWDLSTKLQGALTSSVFLGNVLGCPLAGHLFFRYNEKRVLCSALMVHTVFTFLYAAFPIYGVALINRFFIGMSLSFIIVYTPVWVDEFAPKNRQSVWMASHNAGVPLGIIMGYLLAAGPPAFTSSISWTWSFYIKCVLMVPTIAYVARSDTRFINTRKAGSGGGDSKGYDDGDDNNNVGGSGAVSASAASAMIASADTSRATRREVGTTQPLRMLADQASSTIRNLYSSMTPLFSNVVYMCSVVSLTSLYFVATGLQNFVTQYLREPPFNASMATIMVGFGTAVILAPVCGVIVGGILLDRIGGYQRNLRRVTFFVLAWGVCAVLFSFMCIFVRTTRDFLLVMSVVLFCGGAIIPPGAGLTMASLPDHLRSIGAAFSQTIYNLLGNFSGPLVCGWVADATGSLRYGIITLLLSSVLGVVPIMGILHFVFYGGGGGVSAAMNAPMGSSSDDGALGATDMVVQDEENVETLDMESSGVVPEKGDVLTAVVCVDTIAMHKGKSTAPPATVSVLNGAAESTRDMQIKSPIELYESFAAGPPRSCGSASMTCDERATTQPARSLRSASMSVTVLPVSAPLAPVRPPTQPSPIFTAIRTGGMSGLLRGPGTARPVAPVGAPMLTLAAAEHPATLPSNCAWRHVEP